MRIGVPKEVKNHEYRVAITPAGVHELTQHGHDVHVERGAGLGSSIADEEYLAAGAKILDTPDHVWETGDLILKVKGGRANPAVRIPTTKLGYRSGPGSRVGLTYKVFQGSRLLKVEQPVATIARDNWITIRPRFTPAKGRTYTLRAEVGDINGNKVERVITLVGVK